LLPPHDHQLPFRQACMRRWSKAKTGEGQVVLLSGEPGIGKSRLTAAVL
jgi:predicted ATPase